MPEDEWIAAVDSVYNQKLLNERELRESWGFVPPRTEKMLAKCDAEAQSGTESIARVRLRAAGYRVTPQAHIPGLGHVDLLVGDRFIFECDSETHHSSEEQLAEDARRDGVALQLGYIPRRYRLKRILNEWPSVLAEIRAFTSKDRHRRRGADPTPT
ncbi:hypothetical protein [uncultured Gordonia sp.]|uniref:endonuclease domain-containing protein n=1 Tax=Gordonia sp. (in: high G+C Gram-positive bacteria) TaxID=84139 RepID=UPI0026179D50|nr:hypothetical protein [uncultured Gordonia sp.]HNP57596.1 hypothetical protein [Gordonia sp. (in: high G+C Gram-positive bacteria)]